MNDRSRQPLTLSQALGVLALGYSLVVALAAASSVALTSQFAGELALSQSAGVIAYALFRSWYDSPAAVRRCP